MLITLFYVFMFLIFIQKVVYECGRFVFDTYLALNVMNMHISTLQIQRIELKLPIGNIWENVKIP